LAGVGFIWGGSNTAARAYQVNFGCPTPGWTINTGNSDANGYGNFEFPPPTGFYAMCTKNLAQYG